MTLLQFTSLENENACSLTCENFGGRFIDSFHASDFFVFSWRLGQAHQFLFFSGQDQSTVAQQAEMTGWMFPDKLCASSFP